MFQIFLYFAIMPLVLISVSPMLPPYKKIVSAFGIN